MKYLFGTHQKFNQVLMKCFEKGFHNVDSTLHIQKFERIIRVKNCIACFKSTYCITRGHFLDANIFFHILCMFQPQKI